MDEEKRIWESKIFNVNESFYEYLKDLKEFPLRFKNEETKMKFDIVDDKTEDNKLHQKIYIFLKKSIKSLLFFEVTYPMLTKAVFLLILTWIVDKVTYSIP